MVSSILRLAIAAATLTSLASAEGPSCQHKSDITKQPSGNAISTPGSTSEVPVGVPYDITWKNTTSGAVSLVLLRGPSTNAVDFLCIVDSIPNSGSYSWIPPMSLENDVSHYGIKIVVDATGDYQYSTQFGIVNDGSKSQGSSSTSASASQQQQQASSKQSSTTNSVNTHPTTTVNMVSTHIVYHTSIINVPCSSHECNKHTASTTAAAAGTNSQTSTPRFSPTTSPSKTNLSFTGTGPARANSSTFGLSTGGSVGTTAPSLRLPSIVPGTASTGSGNRTTTEPSPTIPMSKPASLGPTSSAAPASSSGQTSVSSPSPPPPANMTRPPPAAQTGNLAAGGPARAVGAVVVAGLGMLVVV